jgi:DNA polymerase-3 subunit alpha
MFHDKGLLDDIGRCYRIAIAEIKKYKASLIENGGKLTLEAIIRDITGKYPQVPHNIASMLGQLRGYTVHAAGVIVSTMPLAHTTTMMGNTIALDKRDAEYMNLLKIDALSLSTLRVISHALNKIGMTVKELYDLPLNDPKVLAGFQKGNMQGIFQYSGATTKRVCVDALEHYNINADNADEVLGVVIDVNTLSRPASLGNGSTDRYIKNNHESIHPLLDEHTATTRGQIIYQEQIMKALYDGGIDWGDITAVRKIIQGKGDPNKLPIIQNKFINNLVDRGTEEVLAAKVWSRLGDEGAYGFNFAHCVAYTMIAYYTMYFKVYHRTVFYWANLMVDCEDKALMREFEITSADGGKLLPVKFGKSEIGWSIEGNSLRAGYTTVKGIGPKSAQKLITLGDNEKKIAKGVRKKLEAVDAFSEDKANVDFLGLNEMTKRLSAVNNRTQAIDLDEKGAVKVGGKIIEIHFKSLREYYLKDGRDPETIPDPECDIYVNFRLADETSEVVCTVNRYTYAQSYELTELLETYNDNEVIIVDGNWDKSRNKLYVNKIHKI